MRSLLVYPTHANCAEVEDQLLAAGVDACTYPGRQTAEDEKRPHNCWNEDADEAEKIGFPVVKSVCPSCRFQSDCWRVGYLGQLAAAGRATVGLCTHKRIEFAGLADFVSNRRYLSIHENPVNLLRPRSQASMGDLFQLQVVLNRVLNDPYHLNWFGTAKPRKFGRKQLDEAEVRINKDRQHKFCLAIADLVDDIVHQVSLAEHTTELRLPVCHPIPDGVEATLFHASRRIQARFDGSPWRFLLAAVAGLLHSAAVVVSHRKSSSDNKGFPTEPKKFVVGFGNNTPSPQLVTWFSDATMSADRLSTILGAPVADETPVGRILLQKKAVQIPRDINRQTSPKVAAKLLRGVLADRPDAQRVGVICHRTHMKVITGFEDIFAKRIVKSAYFGSGDERSSNAWQNECDLIVVAGTPRVPPDAIVTYLIQIGEITAACREALWGQLIWESRTESGERINVKGSGYSDAIWRRAHQDLVRATLVQAIGRGRGILADGCEVVVLSNEECGLPISDCSVEPLNESTARVLDQLAKLVPETPIYNYIGKPGTKSAVLALMTGLSRTVVNDSLRLLEARGIVSKVGDRSGWRLVSTPHNSTSGTSLHDPKSPMSAEVPVVTESPDRISPDGRASC